jgi:amidase
MIRDEGAGHGWLGFYDTNAIEFFGRSRRVRANDFPTNVKMVAVLAAYMAERYHGRYYAKAQNLRRTLRAAYDALFEDFDYLAMPTTPQRARLYDPALLEPTVENISASLDMINNTCPFDLTHHPAISIPCGLSDGRPVGLQLVARHWHEAELLRAALAFEQHSGLTAPAYVALAGKKHA